MHMAKFASRGVRLFLALMAFLRALGNLVHGADLEVEPEPAMTRLHAPDSDDGEEQEPAQQTAKQGVEQRPPPIFQPMRRSPWLWFDDDSGALAQQMAQQVTNRRNNNFLLVVNGAHRQAMNEAVAAT